MIENSVSESKGFVSKNELAQFLTLHPRSIDNLRLSGLPYVRLKGLGLRFHLPTVQSWILKRQKGDVL